MRTARFCSALVLALSLAGLVAACGGGGGGGSSGVVNPNPTPLTFVNFEVPPVHPLEISAADDLLLLAQTADQRLELFDISTGSPVWQASVPVGLAPVSVRLRTPTEAWVVNHISDTVSIVDLTTRRVVETIQTLDEPCDVVFAGTPEKAFVSCSQANAIQVFDPTNLALAPTTVAIDAEDPRSLAVSPDGQTVYAAIFESGNQTTIVGDGVDKMSLAGDDIIFPLNAVSNPAGPYGGVNPPPNDGASFDPPQAGSNPAPPAVSLIVRKDVNGNWLDDNGGDWTSMISGADAPLSGRPVGWDLLDNDVAVIDTSTLGVTYVTGCLNINMAMDVSSSGLIAVVGTDATNEVRFEPNVNGTFVRVHVALIDTDNLPASMVDLNPHLTYATPTVAPNVREQSIGDPRGVAWNPVGTRAFVTGMGSNNVVVIDATGSRVTPTPIEVGRGPTGIVYDGTDDRVYVWNRFAGSISVIDALALTEVNRVSVFDPTPPTIRNGRPMLYDTHRTSGLGHVSCASCHVDARMDRLAWDLGDPSGGMGPHDHLNCSLTEVFSVVPGIEPCEDFHPMKGPMTTQTLQDIVGHEPHHWRGDRDGLEAFSGAFVGLMGDDAEPSGAEMQDFENFLATIHFPPNPFRNKDNTLPTNVPLPGHYSHGRFAGEGGLAFGDPLPNGNAVDGLDLFRTGSLDAGIPGAQCVTCHSLPTGMGTEHEFQLTLSYSDDPLPVGPNGEHQRMIVSVDGGTNVSIKVPQLRNMYDKVGMELTTPTSRSGFGFLHDGAVDSLSRFVAEPLFEVDSDQETADLVAFLLSFSGSDLPAGTTSGFSEPPGGGSQDAHAAVGWQRTYTGGAVPIEVIQLTGLAQAGDIDLIVKGVQAGEDRGWVYDRIAGNFISDRDGETIEVAALQALAAANAPQTWTGVPLGLGTRLGIDRDEDGFGDRTELDAGSDPTAQISTP